MTSTNPDSWFYTQTNDVYFIIGQSNARGGALIGNLQAEYNTISKNTYFWNGTAFTPLDVDLPNYQNPYNSTGFSFVFSFARKMGAAQGKKVYIMMYAIGGSGLGQDGAKDDWNINSSMELYADWRTEWAAAKVWLASTNKTYVVKKAIWCQGTQDSIILTWANAYQVNLDALFTSCLTFVAAGLGFIIVKSHNKLPIGSYPYSATVRTAQATVAAARGDTQIIDTDDCGVQGDNIHYNAAGQELIGQRIFDLET